MPYQLRLIFYAYVTMLMLRFFCHDIYAGSLLALAPSAIMPRCFYITSHAAYFTIQLAARQISRPSPLIRDYDMARCFFTPLPPPHFIFDMLYYGHAAIYRLMLRLRLYLRRFTFIYHYFCRAASAVCRHFARAVLCHAMSPPLLSRCH